MYNLSPSWLCKLTSLFILETKNDSCLILLIIETISLITGGELFAKRRKKADKWVVDEGTLKSNPSQLADQFFVQQQDFQQQDYQVR